MTSATNDTAAFPYRDRSLSIEQRVADLLARMPLESKVGLLFHTVVSPGDPDATDPIFGFPPLRALMTETRLTHFNVLGAAPDGHQFAAWHNAVQRIAADLPFAIPVTLSTDPRHHFSDNPAASMMTGPFSQWPETLGLAAIGSEETVATFADIARREYLAVGLRVALHPQIDLATEPRWARINGTFGEDADLTSRLAVAYIRGFQGAELGAESVATMMKHFPGGGPQKDGEDPHFTYGREQIYPGDNFGSHLEPFEAAIAAGGSQVMPYYGMPVDTEHEEVGFAFNKSIITGILRDQLHFDGIVCTDWGLITDIPALGEEGAARAWGVEHLSREERVLKAIDAGVDQFGGEACPDVVLKLLKEGNLSEARIDQSAARLLREKFVLGLFDNPFIDENDAAIVVGNDEFRAAGLQAQKDSLTLLTNVDAGDGPTLPLRPGLKVYAEGLAASSLESYATPVREPAEADVAILRLHAPYESRSGFIAGFFHAGSLEFPSDEVARVRAICATVPTVIDVYLDRPAVVDGLVDAAAAIVANFGVSEPALLDVLFGDSSPKGKLPFDLPRSMSAVIASDTDVPFSTEDPIFRFGHGLRYSPRLNTGDMT